MPFWSDLYRLWSYSFSLDPIEKRAQKDVLGAGVTQPDAIPDIRQDGSFWGGGRGLIKLRDTNDFVDLSSVSNRTSRYKEYERLRNISEIEAVMDVYADESCLAGHMPVHTVFFGMQTIKWLAENKAGERFLVYSWDADAQDYTVGWAYDARKVKTARTIRVKLDDGTSFIVTPEHRVLLRNGKWTMAGMLQFGDELMAFYKEKPNLYHNQELKTKQYSRIRTMHDGWKTERQFIDEWRNGEVDDSNKRFKDISRLLCQGNSQSEIHRITGLDRETIRNILKKEGFSFKELQLLGKKKSFRRIIGVEDWKEIDVYDLSVEKLENFCGESIVYHNCQRGENGHMFTIRCKNEDIVEELEFLCFHRDMLDFDDPSIGWNYIKKTYIFGDHFFEIIIDPENPKKGIMGIQELPCDSMYRIETTKGKLVEFQQSNEGPDYQSLTRVPVTQATEADLMQATAVRFTPEQVVHTKVGDDRRTFYPYGVSLIEAARGPAHQLRLMEDAMVVYRLSRAPERRVFYIDVGNLSPARAEAFMERIKDQFRKKKVSGKGATGASSVEERWHPPAIDEDYWLPIRPNATNTRIDTLPGAQNLGEIDDALYFRNKLFTALKFPQNYFSSEDPNATKISLSSQNVRFARTAERLQAHIAKSIIQICQTHLRLRGVPKEDYEDLQITLTPPSEWRELSKQEIINNRISWASNLKGSMIMADWDILTRILHYTEEETQEMQARLKIQKLEDFKLQVLAQNPSLLGVGIPGSDEQEMGTEVGGPNPMLGNEPTSPGGQQPPPPGGEQPPPGGQPQPPAGSGAAPIPNASPEEVKKYDLEIQSYDLEMDAEERDYSEE